MFFTHKFQIHIGKNLSPHHAGFLQYKQLDVSPDFRVIVGSSVGGVVLIVILVLIIVHCTQKYKANKKEKKLRHVFLDGEQRRGQGNGMVAAHAMSPGHARPKRRKLLSIKWRGGNNQVQQQHQQNRNLKMPNGKLDMHDGYLLPTQGGFRNMVAGNPQMQRGFQQTPGYMNLQPQVRENGKRNRSQYYGYDNAFVPRTTHAGAHYEGLNRLYDVTPAGIGVQRQPIRGVYNPKGPSRYDGYYKY